MDRVSATVPDLDPADHVDPELHPFGSEHRDVAGGWLRPAVFGMMDGLVTNVSLIAGVGGGGVSSHTIVLTGLAGLVAGAFSMATGEYVSVSSQNEAVQAESGIELHELRVNSAAEADELAEHYVGLGISEATAHAFAHELAQHPEQALRVHAQAEMGVDPTDLPSPWTAAGSSFVFFAIGAVLPLLPYLFGLDDLVVALAIGGAALLLAGGITARFTRRSVLFSAVRQLALGALAAGVTYAVGALIGAGVS
ncbi:VIT1/CCC1 transporter family protein [Jatrophihabitans sp. YIM 134969]